MGQNHFTISQKLSCRAMQTLIFANMYHNLRFLSKIEAYRNGENLNFGQIKNNFTNSLAPLCSLSWSLLSGAGVQHKLTSFCLVGKRGFHSKLEKARYQREQGKLLTLNDFLFRKHIAYFSQFI